LAALPALTLTGRAAKATVNREIYHTAQAVSNMKRLQRMLDRASPGNVVTVEPGQYATPGGLLRLRTPDVRVIADGAEFFETDIILEAPEVRLVGATIQPDPYGRAAPAGYDDEDGYWQPYPPAAVHMVASASGKTFTGSGPALNGPNQVVQNCDISRYNGEGINFTSSAVNSKALNNKIHDCNSGAGPGIFVNDSQGATDKDLNALVEGNTLYNLKPGSAESIGVKISSVTLRGNRLTNGNCFVNRHGEDNVWVGNILEGSISFKIHDAKITLRNNNCRNGVIASDIELMTGSMPWNGHTQGSHPNAYACRLVGNTARVLIARKTNNKATIKADSNVVESNTGSIKTNEWQTRTTLPGGGTASKSTAPVEPVEAPTETVVTKGA
jgi:hypothetical protein